MELCPRVPSDVNNRVEPNVVIPVNDSKPKNESSSLSGIGSGFRFLNSDFFQFEHRMNLSQCHVSDFVSNSYIQIFLNLSRE